MNSGRFIPMPFPKRHWLRRLFYRRPKPPVPLWAKIRAVHIATTTRPSQLNAWDDTRKGF